MFHNVKRTLTILKLILQNVLQMNSLVPPYSSTFTKIAFPVPEPPGVPTYHSSFILILITVLL